MTDTTIYHSSHNRISASVANSDVLQQRLAWSPRSDFLSCIKEKREQSGTGTKDT